MSQQSKLRQSRQQWKHKAKERAEHHRYLRKELARLRQERDRAKQALKEATKDLRYKEAQPTHLKAHRVWLTLILFTGARIRFRAVSRVLRALAHWLGIGKAPCPQTVINWVMRLSLVRMQSVRLLQGAARHLIPFPNGLIWMMDTSITLGTGKLLSVLAIDAHHDPLAGCAPGFQHVRCIAVAVSPSWSGERLAALLERVIAVVGRPAAYLKDGGSERQKATDVLRERGLGSPLIDDISHAVANMLKRRYATHPQFATFLSACGRVSSRLKHTVLPKWLNAGFLDHGTLYPTEAGTPQGGISTLPTKLQTFFFRISISRIGIDPKPNIDLVLGHFDPLDQRPNEVALARPVGRFQAAMDFCGNIVQPANNQL